MKMVKDDTYLKKVNSIFVSYSWKDKLLADRLTKALKTKHISFWVDFEKLLLSQPIMPQLVTAIGAANKFIVIDTCYAKESQWVSFETAQALKYLKAEDIHRVSNDMESKMLLDRLTISKSLTGMV